MTKRQDWEILSWTGWHHFYNENLLNGVFFEAHLQRGAHFPGRPWAVHFQEANRQLNEIMQADATFAKQMREMFPDITKTLTPNSRGGFPGISPSSELTWHHHPEREGVLQLLLFLEHKPGSLLQDLLHPGGRGGMANWGGYK